MDIKKFYYLFPLIYTAIVVVLMSNYIININRNTYEWGDISISVVASGDEANKKLEKDGILLTPIPISRIKINLPQMTFSFSSSESIVKDDNSATLSSVFALSSGEGFVLSFNDKVHVSFQTNKFNSEKIAIIVQSSEPLAVEFPMRLFLGVRARYVSNALVVSSAPIETKIVPSIHAAITKKRTKWVLSTQLDYASFLFSAYVDEQYPTIGKVPRIPLNIKTEVQRTIQAYLDSAQKGWTSDRFSQIQGTWKQPEGFWGFDEQTLLAMYSESVRRGEIVTHKISLDKSMALFDNYLSWRSATFYQNGDILFQDFTDFVERVQYNSVIKITQKNMDILQSHELWQTIPFWTDSISKQNLIDFITSIPAFDLGPEASIMILYYYEQTGWDDLIEYVDINKQALEQNIIANTVIANNGYLVLNTNKNISIKLSIIAGKYLADHSSISSHKLLGDRILHTALMLKDENGILPRIYAYQPNSIVPFGFVTPEEVYAIIADNPYYPRIKESNIKDIYSFSMSSVTLTRNSTEMDIAIATPLDSQTEYIYIWPIERPKSIVAFDILWTGSTYPRNFTQGVHYNASTSTLVIKTRNKQQTYNIKLKF